MYMITPYTFRSSSPCARGCLWLKWFNRDCSRAHEIHISRCNGVITSIIPRPNAINRLFKGVIKGVIRCNQV